MNNSVIYKLMLHCRHSHVLTAFISVEIKGWCILFYNLLKLLANHRLMRSSSLPISLCGGSVALAARLAGSVGNLSAWS